ncbi:hypothetical protein [Azomonas macrocytogenes]|uniref:Uncharacterized protein n=1 Tax=Azomonas macrocytogenes TaxID=69962 RepID=A0A839T8L6_AZOMA|nr:hypothetical protein [Azomonas macrocytogenes]MBB3105220.1 hypothetical protein [Azomonas macrocytogenes]
MMQRWQWWARKLHGLRLSVTTLLNTPRVDDRYMISRSVWGRLSIRFDGGPFYPEMVNDLESAFKRFGHLVEHGEELSGAQWAYRIIASGQSVTAAELNAIRTLLRKA